MAENSKMEINDIHFGYLQRYSKWQRQGHTYNYMKALKAGKYDEVLILLNNISKVSENDLFNIEAILIAVFAIRGVPSTIKNLALEKFFLAGVNRSTRFDAWMHSFSHFQDFLWEKRMAQWITKLNQFAFSRAREESDNRYLERLVSSFARYSKWFDKPERFGFTSENLKLIDYIWLPKYIKTRITLSPFPAELDLYRWQFKHPDIFIDYHSFDIPIIAYSKMHKIIRKLMKNNGDVDEFIQMEKKLISRHTKILEKLIYSNKNNYEISVIAMYMKRMGKALSELSTFSSDSIDRS